MTPALETRFAHKQEEEENARKREKFGRAGRRRGLRRGGEELDWRRRRIYSKNKAVNQVDVEHDT